MRSVSTKNLRKSFGNKKITIFIASALVFVAGAIFLLATQNTQKDNQSANSTSTTQTNTPSTNTESQTTAQTTPSTSPGVFIDFADYTADPSKYSNSKKIYFFHAEWCPVCKGIEQEINNDPSRIPNGVTLIKVDFEQETRLRKDYEVTYQYTFVQIDNDGKEVAQWTASNLDKVIAGIKS